MHSFNYSSLGGGVYIVRRMTRLSDISGRTARFTVSRRCFIAIPPCLINLVLQLQEAAEGGRERPSQQCMVPLVTIGVPGTPGPQPSFSVVENIHCIKRGYANVVAHMNAKLAPFMHCDWTLHCCCFRVLLSSVCICLG